MHLAPDSLPSTKQAEDFFQAPASAPVGHLRGVAARACYDCYYSACLAAHSELYSAIPLMFQTTICVNSPL
jgi:hypothetical protein